jgi:hypothetical protein
VDFKTSLTFRTESVLLSFYACRIKIKKTTRRASKKARDEDKIRLAGGVGGTILGASVAGPLGAIIGGLAGLLLAESVNDDKKKSKKLTPNKTKRMADNKIIFVAFAIEDESQRNLLKGQSLHTDSPFEYTDMSVKDAYQTDWKEKVRTRIKRSDGVIVLVSKNSLNSEFQGIEWLPKRGHLAET